MAVLDMFNAAVETGRNAPFSDPLKIINDAANANHVANRFLFGEGRQVMVDGGLAIEDVILLEGTGNFRSYQPMTRQSVTNRQPGTKWRCPWAYYTDEMAWTAQEIESQVDAGLRGDVMIKRLKDLMKLKEMTLYLSIIQGIDNLMFATPSASLMEVTAASVDAGAAYSIPVFINEFTNGLYTSTESGTFSTVQAIDPTRYPNWAPKRSGYTSGSETDSAVGIIPAMSRAMRGIRLNKPGVRPDLFTGRDQGDRDAVDPEVFIACSQLGYDTYERVVRTATNASGNYDLTGYSRLDPAIARLSYGGAPLEEVEQLNTAILYPGASSSLQTEANATNAGPRYYIIDPRYLQLAFKADRMMQKDEVMRPSETIDTYYQRVTSWMNLVCTSRRRHAFVYPDA